MKRFIKNDKVMEILRKAMEKKEITFEDIERELKDEFDLEQIKFLVDGMRNQGIMIREQKVEVKTKENKDKTNYENSLMKIIINHIMELPFSVGKTKLIDSLRGKINYFNLDNGFHNLEYFGVFNHIPSEYLETILNMMIEKKILLIIDSGRFQRPIIVVSDMNSHEKEFNVEFLSEFNKKFQNDMIQIFLGLRELRWIISKKYKVPPFMICPDSTLTEIVLVMPTNSDELRGVKGVGEVFMKKYKKYFLDFLTEGVTPNQDEIEVIH